MCQQIFSDESLKNSKGRLWPHYDRATPDKVKQPLIDTDRLL